MTEPAPQSSPFWTFSLRFYAHPEVAQACIVLQDGQGADVNLLLFMLWAGRNGRLLSCSDVRALIELTENWRRDIVVPLRLVRRALRVPPAAIDHRAVTRLRGDVKKAELESERLQQALLFAFRPIDAIGSVGAAEQAAAANVALYAEALGTAFDPASLATILAALAELPDRP